MNNQSLPQQIADKQKDMTEHEAYLRFLREKLEIVQTRGSQALKNRVNAAIRGLNSRLHELAEEVYQLESRMLLQPIEDTLDDIEHALQFH